MDLPVHGPSLKVLPRNPNKIFSADGFIRISGEIPGNAAWKQKEDGKTLMESLVEPSKDDTSTAPGKDPSVELRNRISDLEREVRFLRHHLDQSDDAGRPPFRRPDHVTIGEATRIGRGVTMSATERTPITIGSNSKVLRGTEILGPTTIGNRVFLNRDVYVRSQVTIEDGVSVGPYVRLISDSHTIGLEDHRAGQGKTEPIRISQGAWIGAGATILGGVNIGAGAVVAAGAVVTHDVAANTIVAGVPAKLLRTIEQDR